MIRSKNLAPYPAPIQSVTAGSANAKQFAPGDGPLLDDGAQLVATLGQMRSARPVC